MSYKIIRILLVEDNPGDVRFFRELLAEVAHGQFEVVTVGRLSQGLRSLFAERFEVVLLDLSLPDSQGLETFTRMQSQFTRTPVVVLTGLDDETLALKAVQKGAQDYLIKGQVDGNLLVRSIRHAIERHAVREELKRANLKILEQQKSVIEEERLKVLLQMAGATAHELNQPLSILLGFIGLIKTGNPDPDRRARYLREIETAGNRMAKIVSQIQNIRHYEVKPYAGDARIIDIDQTIKVLSVEDSDRDYEVIESTVKKMDKVSINRVRSIGEALQRLEGARFDLVLFDHLLSDGNGFEFLRQLHAKNIRTPAIMITDKGNEMVACQIIQAGADDYIPKDALTERSLSRSMANTFEKARLRREVDEVQKRMAEMATRDTLTGLYNRRFFMEALDREVARAERYEGDLAFCMIDLDHFKQVNDNFGHDAGDMVLSKIGDMLKKSFRKSDILSRYGGEEFAIIMPHVREAEARDACERFRKMVASHYFDHNSLQFNLTVSMGLASYNTVAEQSPMGLVKAADQALYQAKDHGRNVTKCYETCRARADLSSTLVK
jgi:two-component system cell cycle response regulator